MNVILTHKYLHVLFTAHTVPLIFTLPGALWSTDIQMPCLADPRWKLSFPNALCFTYLQFLEQELWLLGTPATWGSWHFQQTKPVSHSRLKYPKIRSWDQPTNKAKQEFTLHYDQSKLIEPDTLKDLFCSAHVWSFAATLFCTKIKLDLPHSPWHTSAT